MKAVRTVAMRPEAPKPKLEKTKQKSGSDDDDSDSDSDETIGKVACRVAPDTELAGYPANLFCRISCIQPDIRLNY